MSQKSEDKAKKAAKQETYSKNSKNTVSNKKGEQERGGEYAKGQPMSPEWHKKAEGQKAKSEQRQRKMSAYYELLERDKRAKEYRKAVQNTKRMSPFEITIDDWEAENLGTYKEREAKLNKYIKQLNQNYNKAATKERKEQEAKGKTVKPDRSAQTLAHNKYKNAHTLSVEERNELHKGLGLKQSMTFNDLVESTSKYTPPSFKGKPQSRQQQWEERQSHQRVDLAKTAKQTKGSGKHTDLNFKYGSSGKDKKPSTSQRPVNKNTTYNGRDTSNDKGVSGYVHHDWKTPTSIPQPEPIKKDTTKKTTSKSSSGKNRSGGGTPKTQRTPEQLINDVAGIKSSKGTNKSHRTGTKAEQKQKDEYAKYNKEHGIK